MIRGFIQGLIQWIHARQRWPHMTDAADLFFSLSRYSVFARLNDLLIERVSESLGNLVFVHWSHSCMVSITVDRHLEAILNNLNTRWQTPPQRFLQLHLIIVFLAHRRFEILHHTFKMTEEEETHQLPQDYLLNPFILRKVDR